MTMAKTKIAIPEIIRIFVKVDELSFIIDLLLITFYILTYSKVNNLW